VRAGPAVAPLVNTSPVLRRMWHAVALCEEIPDREPTQVWVAGEPWVLVRLDGRLRAFADRCPHRLAPVSAGRVATAADGSDRLVCGYHGWRYDGAGRCDLIPALGPRANVSRRAVLASPAGLTEAYGLVWLAPLEPLAPLPAFPEWEGPGVDRARTQVLRTRASAGQLVDNFLDAAHFPFVHAGSFGVTDDEPLDSGEVTVHGTGVTATFTTPYRDAGEVYTHRVTKAAAVSTTAYVRLVLPHATIGILLACLPEHAGSTRIFKLLTRDDLGGDPGRLAAFVKEEEQILAEDLSILERYPSPELSLDPRVELHTRVDRLSLAWRRVMAQAASPRAG
jgi:phenylpropionate dioxygenase-like ring-hydroxylating dioxygenase large terminal subunit